MINEDAFRLELLVHWRIPNAFHISLLKKYQGLEPIEPVLKDLPEVEELEEIVTARDTCTCKNIQFFMMKRIKLAIISELKHRLA